ncbi:MAG: hypothetical protein AB1742_13785 [bacterium]
MAKKKPVAGKRTASGKRAGGGGSPGVKPSRGKPPPAGGGAVGSVGTLRDKPVTRRRQVFRKPSGKQIARRRFRVESALRKPVPLSRMTRNVSWDELIFAIVSGAGKKGITIEEICRKAIRIKYTGEEIRQKNITPFSNFHNSRVSNVEAVERYLLFSPSAQAYGYREIGRKK